MVEAESVRGGSLAPALARFLNLVPAGSLDPVATLPPPMATSSIPTIVSFPGLLLHSGRGNSSSVTLTFGFDTKGFLPPLFSSGLRGGARRQSAAAFSLLAGANCQWEDAQREPLPTGRLTVLHVGFLLSLFFSKSLSADGELMLDLVLVLLICTLNSVPSRTRGSPCLSSNAHSRNHQKK